jgi:hypothetical protein
VLLRLVRALALAVRHPCRSIAFRALHAAGPIGRLGLQALTVLLMAACFRRLVLVRALLVRLAQVPG